MEYTYDALGRQQTIRAPYEIESGQPFTIRFEYFPEERKAHTTHYAKEGNIDTYTFADSLMRAVETKLTGVVWSGGNNQKVAIISGRKVIDAFGRNIAAYYPITESYGHITTYSHDTGDLQAKTEYDAHDRITSVTLADGSTTRTAYTIGSHDGEPMLQTAVTDALGQHAESYTDAKGRNRETVQHAGGEDIRVKYGYDPVGQVLTVQHPNGRETKYAYDLLGRKLMVNHPDAGETDMTYDAAGNLLTKLTAELRKSISDKGYISYTYDFERLHEVLYPENLFNRVTYTYGKAGDKYNRAGRLALVEDASGGEAYYYGRQGEVTKTVRTVMASVADIRTYVYGATYDSWNRVQTMTYPDGEVVTYHYNAAGQIDGLSSNKGGQQSVIVDKIGYDKDGHTVYTKLGNGSYVTAGQQDYAERMNQIQKQKEAYYKQQGIAPGVPAMKGAYGDPENTKRGYNSIIDTLGNHDVPQGWVQTPRPNTTPGTNPGAPVSWNDPTNPDDLQAGYGYIPNDTTKEETFFYHSDHLGSTSYITDDHANITQYDAYLPYGELLVDEHSSSEELPYKFNGKQFDEETDLYYYGARYLNSVTSLWYGVDPLAEKYANNSSYTYCLDNPIRWIDRKGMKWEDPKEAEKLKNQINTKIESIKKDISNYQKKLMQEGLSTRKVEKINEQINEAESRISNLNKSKSDIDLLGQDENNTYVLTRIDGGRHTVRQGNNEKVYIETSSDALSIHEITHVRQSLTSGGLRFGRGGELLNAGKSLAAIANMEIEAYRMQYSFDTTFPGNTYGKGLNGIDLQSVGNIMDDQHQIVYPIIYDYAVSVRKANEKSLKISKSKMR